MSQDIGKQFSQLQDRIDLVESGKATAEELKDFIDRVAQVKADLESENHPMADFINVMLKGLPMDKYQAAYDAMTADPSAPAPEVATPQASAQPPITKEDVLARVEAIEQKIDLLEDEDYTAEQLKSLIDDIHALKGDIAELNNPLATIVGFMIEQLPLKVFEAEYAEMTGAPVVDEDNTTVEDVASPRMFANGKFDLFEPDFIPTCQQYFEDVALNAADKSKEELVEALQVMKGLPKDFKDLRAESDEEEIFIENLAGQTNLLTKIITRQLELKDSAAQPSTSPRAKP